MTLYTVNCKNCSVEFSAYRYKCRGKPIYCSKKCAELRYRNRLGYMKPGLEATGTPTNMDIAWAAGWFDGEGSMRKQRKNSQQCHMGQKDRWVLDKFKAFFGGSIHERQMNGQPFYDWHISGARCRGFLMTIYTFLSPRRQERIRAVL